MKAIIIMAAGVFAVSSVTAQKLKETEVPTPVKEAFSKKYPGSKARWEKEGADYEAEFDMNKVESSAVYDGNGTFKELEQEIKTSELPQAVTDYVAKNFAGYKLSEAAKIADASGKIMYEAEMKKDKEEFDAIFDALGNFIKKSEPAMKKAEKD